MENNEKMTKADIVKAYIRIRETDSVIPDEVLELMKDSAIEKLNSKGNLSNSSSTIQWCYNYINKQKDSDEKIALIKHLKDLGAVSDNK